MWFFLCNQHRISKVKENKEYPNVGTRIISEQDIKNYVFERFQEVKRLKRIRNLVDFQAKNKYIIMAHNQEKLEKLGNIVASYKKKSFSYILEEYEKNLRIALKKKPTKKMHTNVIMHIFGHFSKKLSQPEKGLFFQLLEKYRAEKITLGNFLVEINPMIFRFDNTYLASQTYFLLYSNIIPEIVFHSLNNDTRKKSN